MNRFQFPTASTLARWGRFNLVGIVGAAVQLAALAVFHRVAPQHYLVDSTAAIEVTLLHNFIWHVRYTWHERHGSSAVLPLLGRFHLTNGLVSIGGNLALMPLLVQHVHMPVIAANAVSIVCCSVINFCLSDRWAFAPAVPRQNPSRVA